MSLSESRLDIHLLEQIDQICLEFEQALQSGTEPDVTTYLQKVPESSRETLLVELLLLESDYQMRQGKPFKPQSLKDRFPGFRRAINQVISALNARDPGSTTIAASYQSPEIRNPVQTNLAQKSQLQSQVVSGRYLLLEKVGAGAFATVYRANDQSLKREVAVKIPHQTKNRNYPLEQFQSEAQMLARLDHPAIVPIYDFGQNEDGQIFIVTKLISGTSLETLLDQGMLPFEKALEIVSQTALALDHAHRRGLIHRDLKPSNILLDHSRQVFITDFGLALDLHAPNAQRFVGTPAYMSPEQASGESHLVDHRSDIFSLGTIFYQLLTGKRPFDGGGTARVLDQVREGRAVPVTRINPEIAPEIERICMKAMTPQIMYRYGSAKDIATEIRQFNEGSTSSAKPNLHLSSEILPKGLNSFDQLDSQGFIQLLPGPRDRHGLPESLGFWKQRIESRDPETAFRVGLLSGPSGSGKSSLVKAGLLPHLDENMRSFFVDAEPSGTEEKLLAKLQFEFGSLTDCQTLLDAMTRLRQRQDGGKCVIVLDQFEQWLSAHADSDSLIKALRQCDGVRLQCLLIVRDDFGMATTRLMQQLEAKIEQGRNFSSVDRFSKDHARQVLVRFAKALGKRTLTGDELTVDNEFIVQAVERLSEENQVIAVKLSLFADLVREREWNPSTLDSFGSLTDLGASFLDEHLGENANHPVARKYRQAIHHVLEALSVSSFEQIKGKAVTTELLARAAGLNQKQYEFSEMLDYLENQLRLLSRVEENRTSLAPHGAEGVSGGYAIQETASQPRPAFQLTHDFLVPSVRKWLDDQKRATRRGRINLLFQQLSEWWQNEPVNRRLPSLIEWLQIRTMVPARNWTRTQQQMMASAYRYYVRYLLASLILIIILIGLGTAGWQYQQASQLVSQIQVSDSKNLPGLLNNFSGLSSWAVPMLKQSAQEAPIGSRERLSSLLTLYLNREYQLAPDLVAEMQDLGPSELMFLGDLLKPHGRPLATEVEQQLKRSSLSAERHLRLVCMLSVLDGESRFFESPQDETVANLLSQNAVVMPQFAEMLTPVQEHLFDELMLYFVDDSNPVAQQLSAAVLAGFLQGRPERMAKLVSESDVDQLKTILPFLDTQAEEVKKIMRREWDAFLGHGPLLKTRLTSEQRRRWHVVSGEDKDWVLAFRVPRHEFADLDNRMSEAGLELQNKITAGAGESLTALWSVPQLNSHSGLNSSVDPEVFQLRVVQPAGGNIPERALRLQVRKPASSPESLAEFCMDPKWVTQLRSSTQIPYGIYRSTQPMDLPHINFDSCQAWTWEAWVYDWAGTVFSQGNLKQGENAVWLSLNIGSKRTIWFGWSNDQGKKYFGREFENEDKEEKKSHIALVFDGKQQKLFLNGRLIFQQDATNVGPLENRPLRLGLLARGSRELSGAGQMEAMRISSVARYESDFDPELRLRDDLSTMMSLKSSIQIQPDRPVHHRTIEVEGLTPENAKSLSGLLSRKSYRPQKVGRRLDDPHWRMEWRTVNQEAPSVSRSLVNSALVLWGLGEPDSILPVLQSSEDDSMRSALLVNLAKVGARPRLLTRMLKTEEDPTVRQCLVLILSHLSNQAIPMSLREELIQDLEEIFRSEKSGAVTSAFVQLFERWEHNPGNAASGLGTGRESERGYFYTGQGHLMTMVEDFSDAPNRTLDRVFVSAHETTRKQWGVYLEATGKDESSFKLDDKSSLPCQSISWFEAARYCNWLSQKEGIPKSEWCFVIEGEEVTLAENYLSRAGYRLPSIQEWQWFASAGTRTPFYFGRDQTHLHHFAWSSGTSERGPRPVGQLLPNSWGLYDIHGNVREWTVDLSQPRFGKYDRGYVCGGSFAHIGMLMKLMDLHPNPLNANSMTVGFRVVKTVQD